MKKKILLLLTHSTDDHDRANAAIALAVSLISMEQDVVIFLDHEGVLLAKKGVAETIKGRNYSPVSDLFPMLIESGVPIFVCTAAAATFGVTEQDLVPGAKIISLPTLTYEIEERETIVL
jgi:predicted peroxiredoxin